MKKILLFEYIINYIIIISKYYSKEKLEQKNRKIQKLQKKTENTKNLKLKFFNFNFFSNLE